MSPRLILLSIILSINPIHAMKRSHSQAVDHWKKKNHSSPKKNSTQTLTSPKNTFYIPDIENILIQNISTSPLSKKPIIATQIINALTKVNKYFCSTINEATYNNNLIDMLSKKLHCSHETIARLLSTKTSKARLNLQHKLKTLCKNECLFVWAAYITKTRKELLEQKLDILISQGVNFEFTYNDQTTQKTPLMLTIESPITFDLLKNHIDINNSTNHNVSALNFVTNYPINLNWLNIILSQPHLKINQQNKRGETPLLRCLLHRKKKISYVFTKAIKMLIKAGADPELGNNRGITPIIQAKQLKNERVINLIADAIASRQKLK